jgi:peptidoglycan/LPS O-acetylase OafA/YrhL
MAPDDVRIEHPNRDRPESRTTRAIVVALLLASAILLAIVTVGGWTKLQGAKPVQVAYLLIYLVLAFYIARWRSGLLPVAAAFAIILLIFAAISGPAWFTRDGAGFSDPLLASGVIGLLTVILVPLQILLIVFAARGFGQKWSVEVEHRVGGPRLA